MHIGLIGGIGPAATDYYYRYLVKAFENRGDDLELTIAHADTSTLLRNLSGNDAKAQAAVFERLTRRLKAAGAQSVAVTSIAGHFCSKVFEAISPLPVIDLLSSVASKLQAGQYQTLGIIGTRTVMESKMYGRLPTLNVLPPTGEFLEPVHDSYVNMAVAGSVTEAQRKIFYDCGHDMCDRLGADAVLLGGTDLALAFDGVECGFKTIDCAQLHLQDIVKEAARTAGPAQESTPGPTS